MSWILFKEELEKYAQSFDPSIKLHTKDHWLMKAAGYLMWLLSIIFTLGQKPFDREKFFKASGTTLAHLHFYPKEWTSSIVERVIPHECRHTRQFRFLGFGIHPLVGLLFGAVVYVFIFFPIKLAIGRAYMEGDAEVISLRERYRNGECLPVLEKRLLSFAKTVSSGFYFYALPESWTIKLFSWMFNKMIQEEKNGRATKLG